MIRRRRLMTTALAAAVIGVILSGCSTPPGPSVQPPTDTFTAPPVPAGARVVPSLPTPPPEEACGDPTASLRPFPPGETPTGPTLDAIRERGKLIVGIDTGSNLMSFRDPSTGTISGFDVDVAREIARDLLGVPNLEFRILSYTQREQALSDDEVDIVAKTMSITCQRRERIDFSSVYYEAHQRTLVTAGSPIQGIGDLAGHRVCVGEGTTSAEQVWRQQPDAEVVSVPLWSDCLVMLQQHQVDAINADDTLLAGLATQDPYTRIIGPSLGIEHYGIGIGKGNDDLVRFVNGTLERIRQDGTWETIYDRWLSELGPSPGPPPATYVD
ncbi:transporter substrate-binding domain-containing protein [Rhodococcus spongiicola]|uniref:ABC transporter substrate-binding protein n=1 Tax=Rhodococcus spongiicola TaxID=2487352 RepID=A0A3S3DY68_9NOCA|nr:transporter substrate-binding domain-containing protein [Rhodococcus spongiicola]RVW01672.1 ABC transporter substrate-binding protein [Rhodococcus spongiicola]